ncbi:hypothetical protein A2W24_01040 [Microgenomates group bacterium RBG_16_45_19]|nr:MAG: hypothetical protein A2W24_01040 [Microgenomates group bacterium RBG_16_45_19]
MKADIVTNPQAFRESFFAEASSTKADSEYSAVYHVLLFYLWRGCTLSLEAGITGKTDPKASLIARSTYEAALAILQLIRVGYHADAATLLRALMERIAIIGYIGENRHLIVRYFQGDLSPYKEALSWAKKKALPNWMIIYSTLSGITHSNIVGPAGHINNHTEIGNAFRLATEMYPSGSTMIEELLGLTVYSLIALDTLALELIQNSSVKPFPNDPGMVQNVGSKDAKEFGDLLRKLVDRYRKNSK